MKKMGKKCLVRNCKTKNGDVHKLFTFPKQELLQREWLNRCGYLGFNASEFKAQQLFVCAAHFEESDYLVTKTNKNNQRWIKPHALPNACLAPEYYDVFRKSATKKKKSDSAEDKNSTAMEIVEVNKKEIAVLKKEMSKLKLQIASLKRKLHAEKDNNIAVLIQQPAMGKEMVHVLMH